MKRILSIAFILLITNLQAQEKNKLSLEHYKNYEWTSNPKLSPDGQQILYSRSWINMVDDKRETDLWIMNKDGSTNRFFLNGSNGKWSPNGDKIAFTKKLHLKQSDIKMTGHAIEFRINAEDHEKDFMPSPGEITLFLPPGGKGVRTDSFVYPGYHVPTSYDSLLGKLIIWASDRDEAIKRGKRALEEFIIDGIKTTIPFHEKVLRNKSFITGDFDTSFIETAFVSDVKMTV